MSDSPPHAVSLRSLVPAVFLPAILYGIGQGAIAPVIALSARELGASVGAASLVVALVGIGQLLGDIPAGAFAAKVGERRAMILAVVLVSVALVVCILATEVWMLGIAILITGLAGAVWGIARHAYLTEVVPYHLRARAMSTLGGTHRIGMFVGPFLAAAAMNWWGTDGAYGVHLVAAVAAALLLASLPEPPHRVAAAGAPDLSEAKRTLQVLRENLPVFRTLGFGALLVGAIRASRQVVIPLWGDHLGLDPSTISIIFGIAGAVDMLLFYPAGKAMDRFGRVWVAVPCMLVMAASHLLLPISFDETTLLVVAMVMGFGNGIGSGIIMTLGADASPPGARSQFLGGWRLCADLGNAGGPILLSGVTTIAGLAVAVLAMGGVGLAGAVALAYWIPRATRSPEPSGSAENDG